MLKAASDRWGLEKVVFVVLGGVMATVAGSYLLAWASSENTALARARRFARAEGLKNSGVSCTVEDPDRDGFVSCSIALKDFFFPLECTTEWTLGPGCRIGELAP